MLNDNLKNLIALSNEATKNIKIQMDILEQTINSSFQNVPEEEKQSVDEAINLSKKAINFVKQGKTKEATELLKNFSYGGKNNQ